MPDVRINVYADTHGAPKQLNDTERALDGIEKGAGKAGTTLGGLWKQFAIGQLAVAGLKKGYDTLKGLVEDAIKGAIDEEKAENNLRAALEITGRTVDGNIQHYLKFAEAQMKVTTYTHEEVQASQALLLQLTNLDQNGIDRATRGAMGLASTMGMDLHGATMMVTKAMEGNYGALGRVGIKVAENLTVEQKQASMLDQLEKLYKRSTAETDTFGGSLKQLKNSWGEVLETAGNAVIKNEAVRDAIKDLKQWVDKLATSPEFQEWLKGAVESLIKAAEFAGKFAKAVIEIHERCFSTAKAQKELNATYDEFHKSIRLAIDGGRDYEAEMKAAGAATAGAKKPINETGTAIHQLTAEQIKAAAEAKKMADEMAKGAQAIIDKYNPLGAAVRKLLADEKDLTKAYQAHLITEAQYRTGMEAIEKVLRGTADVISTTFTPAARDMSLVMKAAPGAFNETGDAASGLDMVFKAIGDSIGVSAATVKVAMWNMAADVLAAYGIIIAKLPEFPAAAASAMAETKNYFDGLFNDIAAGFGNTIQSWLSGATTFKRFMTGLWGDVKNAFFRMIGEMAAKWAINFVKNIIDSTVNVAASITKNVGGSISGLAASAGKMASGFLSALGSVGSIISGITSLIELLKGPQKQTDVTYWLKLQWELLQNSYNFLIGPLMWRLNIISNALDLAIKPALWVIITAAQNSRDYLKTSTEYLKTSTGYQKTSMGYLKDLVGCLKGIAKDIGNLPGAASGAIFTAPSLVRVAERVPEIIMPLREYRTAGGGGGGVINVTVPIYVGTEKIDERIFRIANGRVEWLHQQYRRSNRLIPARTIGGGA